MGGLIANAVTQPFIITQQQDTCRGGLYAIDGNVVLQDANFTQNSGGALYCVRTNISYLGKFLKTQHQIELLLHYSAPSTSETKLSLLEIQLSTVVVQCS